MYVNKISLKLHYEKILILESKNFLLNNEAWFKYKWLKIKIDETLKFEIASINICFFWQ